MVQPGALCSQQKVTRTRCRWIQTQLPDPEVHGLPRCPALPLPFDLQVINPHLPGVSQSLLAQQLMNRCQDQRGQPNETSSELVN